MAALIKHVLSNFNKSINFQKNASLCVFRRSYAMKRNFKPRNWKVQMPPVRKLKSYEDSVASKGFLRCYKEYSPSDDVASRVKSIYEDCVGSIDTNISSWTQRFALFKACFEQFNHGIPNSILHTVNNYDNLVSFYSTPVVSTLPLDRFKTAELPPNLHIQYEPLRFHPDDDMKFNGQTAFPGSNTLVSGLRTRRKFKGHKVVEAWPIKEG